METVSFDNIEYVKASVAAKQFRYTSDYIGQLCRAKKISAKLVGRTWFVNIDSINDYRKSKKSTTPKVKTTKDSDSSEISQNIKIQRKNVPPVLKKRTARILKESKRELSATRKLKVSYDKDEESLMPSLNREVKKPIKPKFISVVPAGATRLKIKPQQKKQTSFISEDMPEIALSGKLKIESYPEMDTENVQEVFADKLAKNIPISPEGDKSVSDKTEPNKDINPTSKSSKKHSGALLSELKKEDKVTLADISNNNAKKNQAKKHAFTPTTVLPTESTKLAWFKSYSPLILTFIAILFSVLILSLVSTQEVQTGFANQNIIFDFENFLDILSQ